MTVRVEETAIILAGRCLVEDAEPLLVAMLDNRQLPVDVQQVERVHMAVAQVLLALRPKVRGMVTDPFLARHLLGKSYSD